MYAKFPENLRVRSKSKFENKNRLKPNKMQRIYVDTIKAFNNKLVKCYNSNEIKFKNIYDTKTMFPLKWTLIW